MNEPIQAGDRCEVIWGLLGEKSPNIGLVVIVRHYDGDLHKFGRMWLCEAEYGVTGFKGTESKNPAGTQHYAQSWLKKLPPEAPPAKAKKVEATA